MDAPAFLAALPMIVKQMTPAQVLLLFNKPDILLNESAQQAIHAQLAVSGPRGQQLLEQIIAAVKVGLMQSLHTVFLVSLGILLVGLFVVIFLPVIELQSAQPDSKE